MSDEITGVITERQKTYGPFSEVAALSQATKKIWQSYPGWKRLSDVQKEGLEHVAQKIARALCGDPNYRDNWIDSIGYLTRILEELDEKA